MKFETELENIKKNFSGKISFGENLSKLSWFNLGGPAKILFRPNSLKELSLFLKEINGKYKVKVLGVGSNTLIRDGGFNGVIIKFGKTFSNISLLEKNVLIAGSSALDKSVSNFAFDNSISGFEFLSCIPGTVGGAIRMNSGCYGEDISKILVSVQVIDLNGKVGVIPASKIKFSYRKCNLSEDLIFISATFKGKIEKKNKINSKMETLINKKKRDQPSKIKTCGSTFKNPKNESAWKLIRKSGCKDMKVGDAHVSSKHSNFFVNKGNAKSKELEELIFKVKKTVFEKTGINLELELQIIGEKL